MEILRSIDLYAQSNGMRYLIIGGHAINAYGISRQTGDLDLLAPRADMDRWKQLFDKLRYQSTQFDERFARFRPDTIAAWPIDLMFVNGSTFQQMYSESVESEFGVARARVVSIRHLAILKMHALKSEQAHRVAKDYSDLLALLQLPNLGISDAELEQLCEKYASRKLYDRLTGDRER